MLKNFIEWAEKDISRGRKVVLLSTIFVFLLITLVLFTVAAFGIEMSTITVTLYVTFVGLVSVVYGFYTGTSSDKSNKLADQAADIMMDKLKKLQESTEVKK